MKTFVRVATALALAAAIGATMLGLLAPWLPYFDLINHFRPFLLVGAALLAAAGWMAGPRPLAGAATLFAGLTLVLTLLPLAYRADQATAGGLRLKIVSLNLWVGNDDVDKAARFLMEEAADVVVLQEADRLHKPLMERVKGSYPHAYCPDRVCSIALLSRIPWIETGKEDVLPRRPLLVWARFAQEGGTVRVIGTHLSYPFRSEQQAAQTQWLIGYLQRQTEPTVIAGDFNLTPFSWKMLELLQRTGLKIHLFAGFSWPAHRYRPAVLLDNVLSTPHFGTLSARIGPLVDSDHRPVIVELARR